MCFGTSFFFCLHSQDLKKKHKTNKQQQKKGKQATRKKRKRKNKFGAYDKLDILN